MGPSSMASVGGSPLREILCCAPRFFSLVVEGIRGCGVVGMRLLFLLWISTLPFHASRAYVPSVLNGY